MKKKTFNDPQAAREAANYENPIPSRELVLDLLEKSSGPLTLLAVCKNFELTSEENLEAMRRRLIAMERDGQLISNRKGEYGRIDKMDLIRGRVQGHKDGFGFVVPFDGSDDLYLSNRQMRKAFDGDEVLARPEQEYKGKREGSIIEVLVHNTQHVVGRYVCDHGNHFVIPDNPRVTQDIFIDPTDLKSAKSGQFVVVNITQQPGRRGKVIGEIDEVLGDHLAPGMEIDVAIRSHNIPHVWPSEVETEAKKFGSEVSEQDKEHRIDLRDLPFVTIDGEDARDFDDAVYCEANDSGWTLYVAIADVSNYVAPYSALDEEAVVRGNSVYFPDFVVPMLPEALSNGLCSLNPAVDRLCMVCEMRISTAGKITDFTFYESVMHSKARLTYTKVGQVIEDQGNLSSAIREELKHVVPHLDQLYSLYQCLFSARRKRGAIEFESNETRILFDENRKISEIVPVFRNDAHKLIEECMLAANVCAANFLAAHEIPALYRVHEPPKEEKITLLQEFLREFGLSLPSLDKISPKHYREVLKKIEGRPDAHLIQTVMLRSMNQAVYQPEKLGHFGLSYSAYAHFTSPIRRYPDLLVHRAIRSVIRSKKESKHVRRDASASLIDLKKIYPYTQSDIVGLGEQFSTTERRADEATRDVVSWLKCEYLKEHVGDVFDGVVSAVVGFGLFVELKDFYVEGLIHITSLPSDYYHHEAAQHRLVGERAGTVYRLGDVLSVRVVRVSLDDRKIDFELSEMPKSKGKPATKKSKSRKPKPSGSKSNSEAPASKPPRKKSSKKKAASKPKKAIEKESNKISGKDSGNPTAKKRTRKPRKRKVKIADNVNQNASSSMQDTKENIKPKKPLGKIATVMAKIGKVFKK